MALTKVSYSMIDGAPVNVLDYGADITGSVDSTAAIQAALDTGNPVVFPFGSYKFHNVTCTSGNIQIDGQGSTFITIPNANTTSQNFFEFTGCDSITLRNFICDGGFGTSTAIVSGATNDDNGITCENCQNVKIDSVVITGWSSGSSGSHDSVAIYTNNCNDVLVQNSRIEYVSKEGIHDFGSDFVRYINNTAFRVGFSPFSTSTNANGAHIIGNKTYQTGVNAASVSMLPMNYVNNVIISNNTFVEHGSSFITPYDSSYGAPGIVIHNESSAGAYTATNWQITNNIFDKMRYALYDGTTLSTKNQFVFQGNQVSRCYECIFLGNRNNNLIISSNTFTSSRRGVYIVDSFGSQFMIDGNIFNGMQGQAVNFQGDSSGAIESRLVLQNNSAVNIGTAIASSVYYTLYLGNSVIQNNIAITGADGNVTSHFDIEDRLPLVIIQGNVARGVSSGNPFTITGYSSANRLMRFNEGYGRNMIGASATNSWEETKANGTVLSFAGNRLWVDSTGKLRIKNGAPTSDTDGVVVGTQS